MICSIPATLGDFTMLLRPLTNCFCILHFMKFSIHLHSLYQWALSYILKSLLLESEAFVEMSHFILWNNYFCIPDVYLISNCYGEIVNFFSFQEYTQVDYRGIQTIQTDYSKNSNLILHKVCIPKSTEILTRGVHSDS